MLDLISLSFLTLYPPETLLLIVLAFLVSGTIKGILGMGMPAILMVSLTLFMPPLDAIPLIVIPMLLINVVQYLRGPSPLKTAHSYTVFAISAFIVIFIVALNLKRLPEELLLISIGLAMVLFAVPSLFGWRFRIGPSLYWQALAGTLAGVVGGLSSVWSPPVVMYLMGRNVQKDDFVGACGFLFMIGSLGLGIALGKIELLVPALFLPSMVGLVLALIGFRIGELIRRRINGELFRKLIMIAFLFMGMRLVLIGLV